jgi:hypothetical protein
MTLHQEKRPPSRQTQAGIPGDWAQWEQAGNQDTWGSCDYMAWC